MFNISVEHLTFLKALKKIMLESIYIRDLTTKGVSETIQAEHWTIHIPSGRVTRAETWLTVYRSLYT